MKFQQIIRNFPSMAEARAFYLKDGWVTVDEASDSYIMTKRIAGTKVGEVIINREGFLNTVADELVSME